MGSFQIESHVSASTVAAGDPLTVTLDIHGAGNFDRVTSSGIPSNAAWKSYRPQASFFPQDSVGREGTKQFEQTIVPLRSGVQELPPLEFSYFDPNSGQYVVRHTQPRTLTVTAGPTPISRPPALVQAAIGTASSTDTPPGQLAPLMAKSGPRTTSLLPVVQRPWFFALPTVPLAVMAAGLVLMARRERTASDPAAAAAATAAGVAALVAIIDEALQAGDAAAFIRAGQRALQLRLAQCWSIAPQEVTREQLDARLDSSWDPIREVFSLAEQSAYAGWHPHSSTLAHWRQIVQQQLHRAERL